MTFALAPISTYSVQLRLWAGPQETSVSVDGLSTRVPTRWGMEPLLRHASVMRSQVGEVPGDIVDHHIGCGSSLMLEQGYAVVRLSLVKY